MADEFSTALEGLSKAREAFRQLCAGQHVTAGSLVIRVDVDAETAAVVSDFMAHLETVLRAALPPAPAVKSVAEGAAAPA